MTTLGVSRPLADLRANLQAQFEAILIESAKNAAASCAWACVSCVETEQEIYSKISSDQVHQGPGDASAMPDARSSAGKLADIASDCIRSIPDVELAQTEFKAASLKARVAQLDPQEVLRKVNIIREILTKDDGGDVPPTRSRGLTAVGAPQDKSNANTGNILEMLARVRSEDSVRIQQEGGQASNESKTSRWKTDVIEAEDAAIEQIDDLAVAQQATQYLPPPRTIPPLASTSPPAEAQSLQKEVASPPKATSPSTGRSLEAAKLYAQRNAELGRYLAEITADLQRACILSSSKPTNRNLSASPLKGREEGSVLQTSGFSSPQTRSFVSPSGEQG